TAARAYVFRNLKTSDRVFINFEADKTMTSFIRISGTVIQDFINGDIDEAEVVKDIQKSGDCMLSPTNDEPRNKRSEEHTSELQSRFDLVCRLLLEKKKKKKAHK